MSTSPTVTDLTSLVGRTVLITGGTTGIGRATARLLANQQARVIICGRHAQELNEALKDIGGDSHGVTADLSDPAAIRHLFEEVDKRFDHLDVAICNAALAVEGLAETDPATIDYVVRTNLLGYLHCSKEAITRMKAQKAGHVVFIGSMSADVRDKGESIYAATKSGIQGFAEALRKEVNELGIRITLIQPGAVGSDMQPNKPTHPKQEEELKMLKAEDIAECVRYCLIQPLRCDIVRVDIRPHLQAI